MIGVGAGVVRYCWTSPECGRYMVSARLFDVTGVVVFWAVVDDFGDLVGVPT